MIGLHLTPRGGAPGLAVPDVLSSFFTAGGGRQVALAKGNGGATDVWTELSPNHAARLTFDAQNPATRLSWRETLVMELRKIYPVGDMTVSSGWSQLQSSGSGLAGSYTGNRAISTGSATATASVTVDRAEPYDVWVHYTGRTSGGYARVEIDGSQALVNEIDDPADLGFKAFSTYAVTDLTRRQSVKVASGLTGAHDVTLSFGGAASPGGPAILLEAVAITGSLSDPQILPPVWMPGQAYAMGDEVAYGGLYYSARGNGQSGTAGPTHQSGIASDGALDWRADDRPTYPVFTAIDYASEREYAVRVQVAGNPTEIGGQTHGNEPLVSQSVQLDGVSWDVGTAPEGLSLGSTITMAETTEWRISTGAQIGDCQITRLILPGSISHNVTVTGTGPEATFEWLYAGMLPMVPWDGEARMMVAQTLQMGTNVPIDLTVYEGTNAPNIDAANTNRIGLTADVANDSLIYGLEAGVLSTAGNGLTGFDAFLRPNLSAVSTGTGVDWPAKAYISGRGDGGLTLDTGSSVGFFNRHVMKVV